MTNHFNIVLPEQGLRCTTAEAEAIRTALESVGLSPRGIADPAWHGFEFNHYDDVGYLEAPENGLWDALPDTVLALMAALIVRAGLPHLEFHTSQRHISGTAFSYRAPGGSGFRIMADGTLVAH